MRVQKKPEERRQEIIDTAKKLFMQTGYTSTQVKDIVGTMGVAQGLFYYYFDSKESVFEAIAYEAANTILDAIRDMVKQPLMPQEKLVSIFGCFIQFAEDEKSFFRLIHLADRGMFHDKAFSYIGDQLVPIIVAIVEEGNQSGVFHCDHPVPATSILVHGIFSSLEKIPHEEKISFLQGQIPVFQGIICDIYGIEKGVL